MVDGYNLSKLKDDTLMHSGSSKQVVNVTKSMIERTIFKQNLEIKGEVDGLKLSPVKIVNLRSNQSVYGRTIFLNGIKAESDIISTNSSLAMGLEDLWRTRVTLEDRQTIIANVTVGNSLTVQSSISVSGTVNDVSLPKEVDLKNWKKGVKTMMRHIEIKERFHCQAMNFLSLFFEGIDKFSLAFYDIE